MSLYDEIDRASFRGVPFYVNKITLAGGQKSVVHEFPLRDSRFVEQLGELPPSFTVDGFVAGEQGVSPFLPTNYRQNVNALKAALTQPDEGVFVHPSLGDFTCKPTTFSIDEEETEFGIATFKFTLLTSENQGLPDSTASNAGLVVAKAIAAKLASGGDIVRILKTQFASSVNPAAAKNKAISQSFSSNSGRFSNASSSLIPRLASINTASPALLTETALQNAEGQVSSEFESLLVNLFENAVELTQDPQKLAEIINELFTEFAILQPTTANGLNAISLFFDFGDNDQLPPPTTAKRIEIIDNTTVMNQAMQIQSFAQYCSFATQITFNNSQELQTLRTALNNQFNKILGFSELSIETKAALQDLLNEVELLIVQQRSNVARVSDIEITRRPLAVLAYQYYGSTEPAADLDSLNGLADTAFYDGDVKVLQR